VAQVAAAAGAALAEGSVHPRTTQGIAGRTRRLRFYGALGSVTPVRLTNL
jgi:hypothetical protein